jgi:hypothetical protein
LRLPRSCATALVAALTLSLAACGSDDKKDEKKANVKATPLQVTLVQTGKTATYNVPATVKGGLVSMSFKNNAKAPHSAQLVRIEGNHTATEAVKTAQSDSPKTPEWLRGEGGLGPVRPGGQVKADVNLPAGHYVVGDLAGQTNGPPAYKEFTVTKGEDGKLPTEPVTITAANPAKDKYKWEIKGALKPGPNTVTFDSKGDEAIHFIGVFRVTGNQSLAEIQKGLASNGPPPAFVDRTSFYNTAVLDGGKAQTTPLPIAKPGTYVLFCPLADREGGKGHDKEGLITKITVS